MSEEVVEVIDRCAVVEVPCDRVAYQIPALLVEFAVGESNLTPFWCPTCDKHASEITKPEQILGPDGAKKSREKFEKGGRRLRKFALVWLRIDQIEDKNFAPMCREAKKKVDSRRPQ